MVKYNHCEKCKKVYNTALYIGEVHTYNGICPSCMAGEQQEDQLQQEIAEDLIVNKYDSEQVEAIKEIHESTQSSPIEIEKNLLSRLEQKANEVLSSGGSVDVLIKEIKDGLVEKAKERIEEVFQSFDVNKIDAQKVVDYVENTCNYVSEYKGYMDCVVKKLQDKPKMKVKTAIEKVFKETMSNMPKDVAKDALLNKKAMLKAVFGEAMECYSIYSDTKDALELTKKMVLHPFKTIQNKLSTLPFYAAS
ncbi:hypothetical protein ES703_122884 [subsurface metagenome]